MKNTKNNLINKDNNKKIMAIYPAIYPAISYENAYAQKVEILKDNKDKSGIYRWTYKESGKSYVGSAIDLTKRLRNYYSPGFLNKEVLRNRSIISNALFKYDYYNFSLDILEYCESSILIEREQYYLDILKPKYNILKIAGSRLGSKHSAETLLKYKDRKLSPEAKANLI